MTTFNGLPLWEAKININDEETGMFCISLVEAPATESNFLAFSEDKELLKYSVQDDEQRKVFGLIMAADMPIYRRSADGYEYFITYSRQTLADMMEKYFKQGYQNQVDTNHNFQLEEGITLTQMFVKDTDKGVNPKGFEEYADGSIFAEFHILNDDVWTSIKAGEYKGFSLAGYFTVEETFNKQNNDKTKMKLNKVKQILRSLLVEMGEVSTDKGILIWDGEEAIKIGDAVRSLNENGEEVDVEDGEYTTEDKKTIVVKEGKVEDIKEVEEPAEEPTEEPAEEPKAEENAEEPAAEEPTEEPTEEPAEDEKDLKIKELEELLKAKDEEIAALNEKIAELENEPAAKSAEEAFASAEVKEDNSPRGKMAKRGYRFQ